MSYLYIWRQKYKFFMEQPKDFNKKSLTTVRLFWERNDSPSFSCGGRIRTCDLQVMSLASYQLLHSAMLILHLFFKCGCKGTTIF